MTARATSTALLTDVIGSMTDFTLTAGDGSCKTWDDHWWDGIGSRHEERSVGWTNVEIIKQMVRIRYFKCRRCGLVTTES